MPNPQFIALLKRIKDNDPSITEIKLDHFNFFDGHITATTKEQVEEIYLYNWANQYQQGTYQSLSDFCNSLGNAYSSEYSNFTNDPNQTLNFSLKINSEPYIYEINNFPEQTHSNSIRSVLNNRLTPYEEAYGIFGLCMHLSTNYIRHRNKQKVKHIPVSFNEMTAVSVLALKYLLNINQPIKTHPNDKEDYKNSLKEKAKRFEERILNAHIEILENLINALKKNKTISALTLCCNLFNDELMNKLGQFIQSSSVVKKLKLTYTAEPYPRKYMISYDSVEFIAKMIATAQNLQEFALEISESSTAPKLSNGHLLLIAKALHHNNHITTFTLRIPAISVLAATFFTTALENNNLLQNFNLSLFKENYFEDKEILNYIANILPTNNTSNAFKLLLNREFTDFFLGINAKHLDHTPLLGKLKSESVPVETQPYMKRNFSSQQVREQIGLTLPPLSRQQNAPNKQPPAKYVDILRRLLYEKAVFTLIQAIIKKIYVCSPNKTEEILQLNRDVIDLCTKLIEEESSCVEVITLRGISYELLIDEEITVDNFGNALKALTDYYTAVTLQPKNPVVQLKLENLFFKIWLFKMPHIIVESAIKFAIHGCDPYNIFPSIAAQVHSDENVALSFENLLKDCMLSKLRYILLNNKQMGYIFDQRTGIVVSHYIAKMLQKLMRYQPQGFFSNAEYVLFYNQQKLTEKTVIETIKPLVYGCINMALVEAIRIIRPTIYSKLPNDQNPSMPPFSQVTISSAPKKPEDTIRNFPPTYSWPKNPSLSSLLSTLGSTIPSPIHSPQQQGDAITNQDVEKPFHKLV